MSILSRLALLIKSNLNDLINRAENPEKMLNQMIIEMRKQLNEAKQQVAMTIADEKRLRQHYESEAHQAAEWERKAMVAVQKGSDDLAKEALARKLEHEKLSLGFQRQWLMQKESSDKLKNALVLLNQKIEEATRKKTLLVARQKRAEAQKKIYETMASLSDTSAFDTFDRMAEKVGELEARAEAATELAGELTGEALEKRFAELETASDADRALIELKAKMAKELPEKGTPD